MFLGLESRLIAAFEGLALRRHLTHAWFVGPNVLLGIAPGATLNVAWTPQITGSGRGTSGRRDLDNFERHQFRIRLAAGF